MPCGSPTSSGSAARCSARCLIFSLHLLQRSFFYSSPHPGTRGQRSNVAPNGMRRNPDIVKDSGAVSVAGTESCKRAR